MWFVIAYLYIFHYFDHFSLTSAASKKWMERSVLNAERVRVWEFGIFDQAQVQDRESSHYGSWQISIESNEKLLYNSVKQNRPNINIQKVFLVKLLDLSVSYIYVCG